MSNDFTKKQKRDLEVTRQLEMSRGKANAILVKSLIFYLYEKNDNSCYRCSLPMNMNNYSIEHIIPWRKNMDNGKSIFFDLNNISFSHLSCNVLYKEFKTNEINKPKNILINHCWCQSCQEVLPNTNFSKRGTKYSKRCGQCIIEQIGISDREKERTETYKKILEKSLGAANNILRRDILFALIIKNQMNSCYLCNQQMSREDYSIEHKKPWLHQENAKSLFFNLNNISFSHQACNYSSGTKLNKIEWPTGQAWCGCCSQFKVLNLFPPSKITIKGRGKYCTQCASKERLKYIRNRKSKNLQINLNTSP